MHLSKKLGLHFILALTLLIADQPLTFRGQTSTQVQAKPVPMSFAPLVQDLYGLSKEQIHPERGTYLIVTADSYAPYLQSFVVFKRSQGFNVLVKPVSELGYSATGIKSFIDQELTDDPMLEYVLLIGDVDGVGEVPSFYYGTENDVSDQSFTHLRGDDLIPDVFIGRFSVDSIDELIVIISKTMRYEQDPLAYNSGWLNRALVVAGNYSNVLPIPVTPKWTSYWVKEELELAGYSSVDTVFYPPVQQGAPFIRGIIDQGVGIVNYRGWGDANGWHYPEFHAADVADLNNGWLTPVFMSFVCNANDFANNVDPCLGEAIIRSGTPSSPKGGVAIIGPSDLHTSTKFNNVINAYMYDAMLDNGVHELAPAMLAGQMGLFTEFPQENAPGESQDKYFNVYNVLGDPSLTVFTGTPDQFSMDVSQVSANDNYVEIQLKNSNGHVVPDAVIAILSGGELLMRGRSDAEGRAYFTLDTLVSNLDVYANRADFIQGHEAVTVQSSDQDIILTGYSLDTEDGTSANIGDLVAVTPTLTNQSGNVISAGSGSISSQLNGQVISASFDYPEIPVGETVNATTPASFRVSGAHKGAPAIINLMGDSGNWQGNLVIPIHPPDIIIQPDFVLDGPVAVPSFIVRNIGSGQWSDVSLELTSLADSLEITSSGTPELFTIDPFSEQTITLNNVTLNPGQVSPGSDLSYEMDLLRDTLTVFHHSDNFSIPIPSTADPVAHDRYGYWMYDDLDLTYSQKPEYNWVELDPVYGGSGGTYYPLYDDDHVDLQLPFSFKYYGDTYSNITVSSNGWISFLPCQVDYFWNYSIPMAMGPRAQVSPFWDDLEVVGTDSIRVFTRYDETDGRYVIEWSRALNNFDESTAETFELILYTQEAIPTGSGDGVIDFQYNSIGNVDVDKNYATVGIESADQNDGIQITFNNEDAPGAAPLENNRVYRITTEAPTGYVESLYTAHESIPQTFSLQPAYPNPFNPTTTIPLTVGSEKPISAKIYDITGRLVYDFGKQSYHSGVMRLSWNGRNQSGNSVASGTYFLRVMQNGVTDLQKLVLIK